MEKKKEKLVEINGHAKFDKNHRLVVPKRKTAEELLAELPVTPETRKIDREIKALETKMEKKKDAIDIKKEIKASTVLEKLCKCKGVTTYFNGQENVVKHDNKTICWVAERKRWVSVSTWGKSGKDWHTERVHNQKEMYKVINKIKERL